MITPTGTILWSMATPTGMTSIISMYTMPVGMAPSHMPMNTSTHP